MKRVSPRRLVYRPRSSALLAQQQIYPTAFAYAHPGNYLSCFNNKGRYDILILSGMLNSLLTLRNEHFLPGIYWQMEVYLELHVALQSASQRLFLVFMFKFVNNSIHYINIDQ